MRHATELSAMRALAIWLLILSVFVPVVAAQSPVSFDLSLSPNTSGTLEGSASLRVRLASFAESALLFSSSGFLEEYQEGGGTTTVIRARKTLDFEAFRLPSDVLTLRLGKAGLASLSPVALINGVILDEDKYGQGTTPAPYVYFVSQRTMWLKPLLGADLGFILGPLHAEAYYRTSWPFKLNEYLDGSATYPAPVGATSFSARDEGFETRLGGNLSVNPAPGWILRGGVDWVRHIGNTVSILSTGDEIGYVYESRGLEGSLTMAFPLRDRRPMIGVAYARDSFSPVDLFSVEPYTNDRIRIVLGLEL